MRMVVCLTVAVLVLCNSSQSHAFGRKAPRFKAESKTVELEPGTAPLPCKEVRKRRGQAEDVLWQIDSLTGLIIEEISELDSDGDHRELERELDQLAALRAKLAELYPVSWNEFDRGQ